MSELERWASPGARIIPTREERSHRRAIDKLINETRYAGLRVDAEAALTGRIMERAVDLDGYRKHLADVDPVLDAVLTRIEVNFVDKAGRIQRQFGSAFPQ